MDYYQTHYQLEKIKAQPLSQNLKVELEGLLYDTLTPGLYEYFQLQDFLNQENFEKTEADYALTLYRLGWSPEDLFKITHYRDEYETLCWRQFFQALQSPFEKTQEGQLLLTAVFNPMSEEEAAFQLWQTEFPVQQLSEANDCRLLYKSWLLNRFMRVHCSLIRGF